MPGQLPGPGIAVFHVRGRKAFDGHQGSAEGDVACEGLLEARGRLRDRLEHLQPLRKMTDGFEIGRTRAGPLACPLPVGNGLLPLARLRVVMREEFGLGFSHLRKLGFEHQSNPLVILLPRALQ